MPEMKEAYQDTMERGSEAEYEELSALPMDLAGPKWNSHSNRRGGTKRSRDTMEQSGARGEDVDRHYGWAIADFKKTRQVAYAGTLPASRRMAVTAFF